MRPSTFLLALLLGATTLVLPIASACAEGQSVCVSHETSGWRDCFHVGIDPPRPGTWFNFSVCTPDISDIRICPLDPGDPLSGPQCR